jgi:hypothetical protein
MHDVERVIARIAARPENMTAAGLGAATRACAGPTLRRQYTGSGFHVRGYGASAS